jgi:predicted transposase YdaD
MQIYDKLWKGIIEDLFEDFLHFYFSDLIELIDFSKKFEFLDQELALLFPETEGKDREVDKLVKVFLLNGEEVWILLHIEVQGYYDKTFTERMYISNYRIYDRFRKKMIALAIFTDKQKSFKPNIYTSDFHGTEISYKFRTYKVLDQDKATLMQSENPFALVTLAVLAFIEKGEAKDDEVMNIKWELARLLFSRNYTKKTISKLFEFINYYIRFENSQNYSIFAKNIQSNFQNIKSNMGLTELIIQEYYQDVLIKGREEGVALGREEGVALGREEGVALGREEGVALGREEGEVKGMDKKTIQVITNLHNHNPTWSDEMIADLAGTSLEKVKAVRATLKK